MAEEIEEVENFAFDPNFVVWPNSSGTEGPPAKVAKLDETFDCLICLQTFSTTKLRCLQFYNSDDINQKSFREQHRKEVHGHITKDGPAECPHCKEVFQGYQKLKNHVAGKHQNSKLKCKDCDMIFRNSKLRSAHWIKEEFEHFFSIF